MGIKQTDTSFLLRLDKDVKKLATEKANSEDRSLNTYINRLIKQDLGGQLFTQKQLEQLQSEVHEYTGNGQAMACFNKLLGVVAGS